jgi:hypothetical protein
MLRHLLLLILLGMVSSCAMLEKKPERCSAHESLSKSGWKASSITDTEKDLVLAQLPKHKFASNAEDYWYQSRNNNKVLVCRQSKSCSPQTWQFSRKRNEWILQKTGSVVCKS